MPNRVPVGLYATSGTNAIMLLVRTIQVSTPVPTSPDKNVTSTLWKCWQVRHLPVENLILGTFAHQLLLQNVSSCSGMFIKEMLPLIVPWYEAIIVFVWFLKLVTAARRVGQFANFERVIAKASCSFHVFKCHLVFTGALHTRTAKRLFFCWKIIDRDCNNMVFQLYQLVAYVYVARVRQRT